MTIEWAIRTTGCDSILMARDSTGHWTDVAKFYGTVQHGRAFDDYYRSAEIADAVAKLLNVSGVK